MALVRVSDGLKSIYTHLDQYADHLEGAVGSTLAWLLRTKAGEDFQIMLADSAGVSRFVIRDLAGNAVFIVNSDGAVTAGALTIDPLIVPGEATPTATDLGNLRYDEDGFFLTAGTGAATKRLGLVVGAGATPTLTGEMAYDTTVKSLLLHNGTAAIGLGTIYKYKTTNQNFANTTPTAVAATSGNVEFPVLANTAYEILIDMTVDALGTAGSGGISLSLTGPASPTRVQTYSWLPWLVQFFAGSADAAASTPVHHEVGTNGTTFTTFLSVLNAPAVTGSGTAGARPGQFKIRILVVNGSTAGTVALLACQTTAAGTSSIAALAATCRPLAAA